MANWRTWSPAAVMGMGAALVMGIGTPQGAALRRPLATLPDSMGSYTSEDRVLDPQELAANGASAYLLRFFMDASGGNAFSVYVGYYAHQRNGKTIHSPKNCLPGSGWEPLAADIRLVEVEGATVPINRYVLAQGGQRALVYYWYQGRGRVAASEYQVKWELLRDAALKARSEEAMVRIVIPLGSPEEDTAADDLATDTVRRLVPTLDGVLPT